MAAGLAYFGLLALVPLLIIGLSVMGYVLGSSEEAHRFITKLLAENFPESAAGLVERIDALIAAPGRHFTEGLGLAGLIWSGLRFFSLLERVLSSIWIGAIRRKFIYRKTVPIAAFCFAGALFWLSFIYYSIISMTKGLELPLPASISAYDLHWLWQVLRMLSLFITSVIIFFLIYDFMPGSEVSSRAAFVGAIFAGLFWEISKVGFNWAMKQFNIYSRTYEPLYGSLAALILLMFWVYTSMIVLLLGAEIGSAYQEVKSEK